MKENIQMVVLKFKINITINFQIEIDIFGKCFLTAHLSMIAKKKKKKKKILLGFHTLFYAATF